MAGTDSPAQLVALVGAPRSGTTWLQTLVGSHPTIVSPQETSLFANYVAKLDESWHWALRGSVEDWAKRRFIGLPAVLTEDQFVAIVGVFVQEVLDAVLALKPGASIVVEKTPLHSLHVDVIAKYFPATRFLHIVRDGRDVAASLVAASRGWGTAWGAPQTVGAAAGIWRDFVEGARAAAPRGSYLEVRYEDLLGDAAVGIMREVFAFCGAPSSADEVRDRIAQFSIAEQRSGAHAIVFGGEAARHLRVGREPEGFYGRGESGNWRTSWSVSDCVEFADAAGPLLNALGYESDQRWMGPPAAVRRARRQRAARAKAARVVRGVGRRIVRAGDRIG